MKLKNCTFEKRTKFRWNSRRFLSSFRGQSIKLSEDGNTEWSESLAISKYYLFIFIICVSFFSLLEFLHQSTPCLSILFQRQQFFGICLNLFSHIGLQLLSRRYIYYQSTLYNLAQILVRLRPQIFSKLLVKEYPDTLHGMVRAVPEYFVASSVICNFSISSSA